MAAVGLPLLVGLFVFFFVDLGDHAPYVMVFDPDLPGDFDPLRSFTVDAGALQEHPIESYSFTFRVNSLGFRGVEVDLGPDTKTIIVIGDGYGFGTSVDGDQTMSDELNRMFNERFPFQHFASVNASSPGYSFIDAYDYMSEKGYKLSPVLLIIVMSNDDIWEMARPVKFRMLMQGASESNWDLAKLMYYRYKHGLFRSREIVLSRTEDSEEEVGRKLTDQYMELMNEMLELVNGWEGKILIVTESLELPFLRQGFKDLRIPIIVLHDFSSGRSRISHMPDGHWTASTHLFAAQLVTDWIGKNIVDRQP